MSDSHKHDGEYLDHLRHSAAHLLAAAVLQLWPNAKRTIGPSIENGFYFDFDFGDVKITEDDFPKIEAKMKELLKSWNSFEGREVSKEEALEEYKDNEYKQELINEFAGEGQSLTFYKSGDYEDLCRGGHVENPSKEIGAFKILSLAGAYWRGDEKNKMLTRIYATAFPTQEELDSYLNMLEEAKKRDHKVLGTKLDLFMFHETSPGMPYWLPRGLALYNELVKFWRIEHDNYGYQEIASPLLNKSDLYVTSGHWEHYKDDMFVAEMGENEVYGIKPMNCPNAMLVFGSRPRSYRELPLRLSDTDRLHRYERSGALNGLLRVRSFQQDDSHNYISEDMIEAEYQHIFEVCEKFYSIFGLEYSFRMGTMPESHLGDIETWQKAEAALKSVLEKSGKDYFIEDGDGAFYGPKIDILMKDSLGRQWQMGTIQLDFQQPQRFELKYTDKDGLEKTPVVVHRVIYGSLERFIGIIIEHFGGAFPLWISPMHVSILPISTDKHADYANKILAELKAAGIRAEVDDAAETLGNRIRKAQGMKVPYMLVIGDKEMDNQTANVRLRNGENLGELSIADFVSRANEKISSKALDL